MVEAAPLWGQRGSSFVRTTNGDEWHRGFGEATSGERCCRGTDREDLDLDMGKIRGGQGSVYKALYP
jgi:hypothetical protein